MGPVVALHTVEPVEVLHGDLVQAQQVQAFTASDIYIGGLASDLAIEAALHQVEEAQGTLNLSRGAWWGGGQLA